MTSTIKIASPKLAAVEDLPSRSPSLDVLLRLWGIPSARIGGFIVVVMVAVALIVATLDAYDARRDQDLRSRYAPPDCVINGETTCQHPFGADKNGRDIMRRVGHGMSVSLSVGVFVVVIALVSGTIIGLTAGFLGGG